jgi:multimeric flavodoxin WrbA
MKVTLINGNPDNGQSHFEAYAKELATLLEQSGMETSSFKLRELNILSCTGCWGCWVKTPGECLFADDTVAIRRQAVHSDWVIFLSPLKLGFTSALLKKVQDKFIPLVHPYIELVNNECHHEKRYEKYPKIGLVYAPEADTDEEDLEIVSAIYGRFAINFKSEFGLFKSIEEPPETLIDEINMH